MKMSKRRQFLKESGVGLGFFASNKFIKNSETDKKKIVCLGGHPDDPESGCGGTLAKFAKNGHIVSVIYLTTGEAGIPGKTHDESAKIRKQEAINACKILGVKPIFAGQIDGDTIMDNVWAKKITELIKIEKPDILFTHWPIDSHKDHQIASLLAQQAWQKLGKTFELYFFEVCAGEQTACFKPTDYVDITDTQMQKKQALYCHTSQDPPGIYACGHADMEIFRGREFGVKYAEGFVRMNAKNGII